MATHQIPSPSHPGAVISLRDLRVSYGEREILHGISFDVRQGETLVILGGSGSGKSTLLRSVVDAFPEEERVVRQRVRPRPMVVMDRA